MDTFFCELQIFPLIFHFSLHLHKEELLILMNLFLSAVSIAQMFLLVFRFLYRYIINADCMEKQMPVSLSCQSACDFTAKLYLKTVLCFILGL